MKILLCLVGLLGFFIVVISSNSTVTNNDSNLNPDWSYCFEFTWVGPAYDNITRFNSTCADYLDETRAKNLPCSPPIVITEDGSPPDINYLFNNHKSSVLCKRTPTQVCATWTYRFSGLVTNSTYMCTKVKEVGGDAITSTGCYKQMVDGYEVELCVCKSSTGLYKPCNGRLVTYP